MNELTSAVDDKELVAHFKEILAPYILQNQLQLNKSLGMPSSSSSTNVIAGMEIPLLKLSRRSQKTKLVDYKLSFIHVQKNISIDVGNVLKVNLF